jgi:hypothetical protein
MTKNQMLRQIEEIKARLQHQIDVEAEIPAQRIGRDADVLPLHLKLRLIDAYLAAGLTQAESLDELPGLTPEGKREITRYLVWDQFGEDIDASEES